MFSGGECVIFGLVFGLWVVCEFCCGALEIGVVDIDLVSECLCGSKGSSAFEFLVCDVVCHSSWYSGEVIIAVCFAVSEVLVLGQFVLVKCSK